MGDRLTDPRRCPERVVRDSRLVMKSGSWDSLLPV
jgi:hypothetical protein